MAKNPWPPFWAGAGGSVVAVILTVFVGFLATVFYQDIYSSWPITLWNGVEPADRSIMESIKSMHRNAITFWGAFGVFTVALFFRELHRISAERRTNSELQYRLDQLREIVTVMPPKNFLADASNTYNYISREVDLLLYGLQGLNLAGGPHPRAREALNTRIRHLLDAILNLLLIFLPPDGRHNIYTASIYWLTNIPDDLEDRATYWQWASGLAHTKTQEAFMGAAEGLLVQDMNLTTNTGNIGQEAANSQPICMGYFTEDGEGTWLNHPGVPLAMAYGESLVFEDSLQNVMELPHPEEVKRRIKTFYTKHPELRSLLAIPVAGLDFHADPPEATTTRIPAILAISCAKMNIISPEEKANMFIHELAPFLHLLYRLCWQRMVLDNYDEASFSLQVISSSKQKHAGDSHDSNH